MKNLLLVDDEKMPLVTHHDEDHQGDHHDDHDNYDILSYMIIMIITIYYSRRSNIYYT